MTNLVAIDCAGLPFERMARFVQTFARAVYTGKGTKGAFAEALGVSELTGLELMLGVEPNWLTRPRRLLAEAAWKHAGGLPMHADVTHIWTDAPNWHYLNPNASDYPLEESILDLDWLRAIGLRPGVWEKEVFFAAGLFGNVAKGQYSGETNFRWFMALAAKGFPDPNQFFRPRPKDEHQS